MSFPSLPSLCIAVLLVGFTPSSATSQSLPRVLIQTELGDIEVVVDTTQTDVTGKNFLRYVDEGFYDGGRFFRTVTMNNQPNDSIRIDVIQAGIDTSRSQESYPAIPLERTSTTGIRHSNGAISMARGAPDTATSSFFICIADQPSLDYGGQRNPDGQGFAAFGRVVSGMDVVRRIHRSAAVDQTLQPSIAILQMRRVNARESTPVRP